MTIRQFAMKYGVPYHMAYEASKSVKPIANYWYDRDFPERDMYLSLKKVLEKKIMKKSNELTELERMMSGIKCVKVKVGREKIDNS